MENIKIRMKGVVVQLCIIVSVVVLCFLVLPSASHAATKYWIGSAGGSFSSDSNWSTSSGGSNDTTAPGSSDIATFDGGDTDNASIDSNINVAGIDINTGYTGTITQSSGFTVTVGSSNYDQAAGTFTGGDSTIDINGTFTLSGGAFTSTGGTVSISSNMTISGGTFNHNSGIVAFDSENHRTIDIGSAKLNHLTISNEYRNLTVTGTVDLDGNLTITGIQGIYTGTIAVAGNVVTTDSTAGDVYGTGTILFDGSGDQTLSASGGTGGLSNVNINKASGTLTIQDTVRMAGNWTYTAGIVDASSATIEFTTQGHHTVDSGSMVFGDVTLNMEYKTLTVTGTMDVDGSLLISGVGQISSGTIAVSGNATTTDTVNTTTSSTGTLLFDGSNDQMFGANGGSGSIGVDVTINKSGGTLTMQDSITVAGDWTHTAGTVDPGSSTLIFYRSFGTRSLDGGSMSFNNITLSSCCMTFSITGTFDVNGDFTISSTRNINGSITLAGDLVSTDSNVDGTATITLDGTSTQTITAGSSDYFPNGAFTINKASGSAVLASALQINDSGQDLTITSGTLDLAGYDLTVNDVLTVSSGATLQLQGAETVTATTKTLSSGSTVVYTGDGDSAADTYTITGLATTYHHLTASSTDSTTDIFQLGADLTVNGNLTITDGTFSLDGNNLILGGSSVFSNIGTFQLHGAETISNLTMDTDSGTVVFTGDGDSAADTYTITSLATTFNNLIASSTDSTTDIFKLGAALTVNGTLTVTDGTVNANGNTSSITGQTTINGGILQASTATQTYSGGLIVSGGTFTGSSGTVDVNSDLTVSSGTLTAPSGTLTVSGDLAHSGGTLTHNSGTITLDGTTQTISGSTTFNNFTKTVSSADTLTFTAATTQTIAGTMTLQGASGQLLSLRSSSAGTQWKINPQGTRTINYLDVKDSNNINSTGISTAGFNITDSGNNTNWTFADTDGIASSYEDRNSNGDFTDDDTDGDGTADFLDNDDDGDGVATANENPDSNGDGNPEEAQDTDGDGTPDYLDTDDDNDGILTINEDANGNGNLADDDTDGDGIADYLDAVSGVGSVAGSSGAIQYTPVPTSSRPDTPIIAPESTTLILDSMTQLYAPLYDPSETVVPIPDTLSLTPDAPQSTQITHDDTVVVDTPTPALVTIALKQDLAAFNLPIPSESVVTTLADFVITGSSHTTQRLGHGERRALLRDYFDTLGWIPYETEHWRDIERIADGEKPLYRNFAREQEQLPVVLDTFQALFNRRPDFTRIQDDRVWNTLMYRIRPHTRDIVRERAGIFMFTTVFSTLPTSPFDWAVVRVGGYVL